jgi:methionyl-tRNA formyltransferase
MGTPAFAVPSLQILLDAGYPVVGVVTATDKLGGRGHKETIVSAVKSFALDNRLKILQPPNLKSKSFLNELRELKADLQVVVAFRMLPEAVWNMPAFGTVNLHASLLPAYRGAAPINWAIINGELTTGLTTFLLSAQIDTGNIIHQRSIPILEQDDAGTLHDRMMHTGAGLLLGSVDLISAGQCILTPQNDAESSHAPKIHHHEGHIDWSKPAMQIQNLIRGMSPYPGAWTIIDGREMKIFKSRIHQDRIIDESGKLLAEDKKLFVQAKDGLVEILEVQLSGKKRMATVDFMNGYQIKDWQST